MEQLPLVAHQEPNWDSKVNNVINFLNSNWGGVGKPLSVSGSSEDGLVFANGFHQNEEHSKYRYVQFDDNARIVELFLSVWGRAKKGDQKVLILPDMIKPNYYIQLDTGWGKIHIDRGEVWLHVDQDSTSDNDHVIVAHTTYFAKK